MPNNESIFQEFANFVKRATILTAKLIRSVSGLTYSIQQMLDQIQDQQQWWREGIGPDANGVYPDSAFSQQWDNDDDPPSYDLSA